MTSSLDWAGIVPAVAAAVQSVAVVVQVYWDRRQRGAGTTQRRDAREVAAPCGERTAGVHALRLEISVVPSSHAPVAVCVHVAGASGVALPPGKEHGSW
ncbi:hypothetical protein [Streptomyces sp. NPDC059071]|uniref:hypothetical protein n=1 Tax=unclassified Streptomyces TaxID=2593676 RepID=UPI00365DB0DD